MEYVIVYMSKEDLNRIYSGNKTFAQVASDTEIVASLDLKPAVHMKPVTNERSGAEGRQDKLVLSAYGMFRQVL